MGKTDVKFEKKYFLENVTLFEFHVLDTAQAEIFETILWNLNATWRMPDACFLFQTSFYTKPLLLMSHEVIIYSASRADEKKFLLSLSNLAAVSCEKRSAP